MLPLLVWLMLSTIWGSTWLFIKVGLNENLPPLTFAGLRFAVASVPLLVGLAVRRTPLPRKPKDWAVMVLTGVLTFTLTYGLVFLGERLIPSGLTAILFSTLPLFSLGLAHWLVRDEHVTALKLIGILLGIGGVTLIFYSQFRLQEALVLWGSAAIVASAFVSALSSILVKNHARHLDPVLLSTVQMVAGTIPLLSVSLPLEGNPMHFHWTPMSWVALFYLAWVGSALPFVLLYWLINHMPIIHINLIALSSTLVAVVLGWLVLGETIGWHTLIGGAVILVGLFLTMWQPRPKA